MRRLEEFLKKFSHLTPPQGAVTDSFRGAVRDITGIIVDPAECSYLRGVVHLSLPSVKRSEILLHKAHIMRLVHERLSGHKVLYDIR